MHDLSFAKETIIQISRFFEIIIEYIYCWKPMNFQEVSSIHFVIVFCFFSITWKRKKICCTNSFLFFFFSIFTLFLILQLQICGSILSSQWDGIRDLVSTRQIPRCVKNDRLPHHIQQQNKPHKSAVYYYFITNRKKPFQCQHARHQNNKFLLLFAVVRVLDGVQVTL